MSLRPALAALLLAFTAALPAADTYRIDPVHSAVTFRVRYLVGKVAGSFGTFSGTLVFDPARPAEASVEARIEVASVNTQNAGRDEHLRKADFFDAARFPAMTFKSTRARETAKGRLEVTGDLTMRGTTRPVVLSVAVLGSMLNPRTQAMSAGFSASTRLNRADYGMSYGTPMVGEEVEIELEILAEKVEARK